MKIRFTIGEYDAGVSSHGVFWIEVRDVPGLAFCPLPGLLIQDGVDRLNETWDPEGRDPMLLEPHDDGMPTDLSDPRILKAINRYIVRHSEELSRKHVEARNAWKQMQQQVQLVDGQELRPGTKVRLLYAKDGIRDHAEDEGLYTFLTAQGNTVYLSHEGGIRQRSLSSGGAAPFRYWIEPSSDGE